MLNLLILIEQEII